MGGVVESLKTHPLHVDHVAEAILKSIVEEEREGVIDVDLMREWAGFEGGKTRVNQGVQRS